MVGPGPTWSRRSGGIPVRVGVVAVGAGQDLRATLAELEALGVASIDVDRVREVGRGVRGGGPGVEQLCGHCADGVLAVSPNGEVWPCVFARWLVVGNVRTTSLADLNRGARPVRERLRLEFRSSARSTRCPPNDGNPCDGPLCLPHLRHPPRGPRADR
jgi:MoaA/NifB/PqqE/SkfB family radical SAM enzyme